MLLERLQKHTGLSLNHLERYASTASKRYKVYQIPKRTHGFRTIEQPSREIKALQRWLIQALIKRLPVHESATAYSKGSSIRQNASKHAQSNFTLRADFESFFPSFNGWQVATFLTENAREHGIQLTQDDIAFVRRIVCRHESLTIGAPSSPLLTNAMMFDFDILISNWCEERDLVYTRYADDLFISSDKPNMLSEALGKIEDCAQVYRFAALRINREKTAFLSRRYRRSITGITVTPTRSLSIGRDRKMRLKSDVYEYQQGRLSPDQLARVHGMLAFVMDVEPTFYSTLTRKYGNETIEDIKAGRERSPTRT